MERNRTWLVFANENICNHRKALKELGFVNWTTNVNPSFHKKYEEILALCEKEFNKKII